MKVLVFDTETTGKANFRLPASDPSQPRIVQLAMALYDTPNPRPLFCLNCIVRPEGFTIPAEATAIHAISTELAHACGVSVKWALDTFRAMASSALLVAHNVDFDCFMIGVECCYEQENLPMNSMFCTMKSMTNHCNLPGPYGPKWPKLSEAYKHCTGKELEGAHDALNDLRATKVIYDWLQEKEGK